MTQLKVALERAIVEDVSISLDSSALIAFLANENPHARFVTELLESDAKIVVSTITASEGLMRTVETYGRDVADDILASLIGSSRMFLVPFDRVHILETAAIRAATRLKLPDAAIVATARMAGALAIVGNDRVWQTRPLGIQYIHLDDVVREAQMEQEPR